jgi:hypothetical protein
MSRKTSGSGHRRNPEATKILAGARGIDEKLSVTGTSSKDY